MRKLSVAFTYGGGNGAECITPIAAIELYSQTVPAWVVCHHGEVFQTQASAIAKLYRV